MAAAAASVPVRELDDVTECPICAEELTDARVLPCIHTFCLKCLQDYIKSNTPGEKLPCPLCRQGFDIPKGGIPKLPKNYFVDKVLQVKKLAFQLSKDDVECDLGICGEDKNDLGRKAKGKATMFCIECTKNMCAHCFNCHKKFKANASHKVIGLNEQIRTEDVLAKLPENSCDKHSEESIKLYCSECKLAVCIMCFAEEHSSHKCSDVKKVADELTKQLDGDITALRETDKMCNELMKKLEGDKKKLTYETEKAQRAISAEADKLHNLVTIVKQKMLAKLSEVKKNGHKEIESIREEAQLRSVIIRNFIQYETELKRKGTACDIAKLASSMHERAKELHQFDLDVNYNIKVKFTGNSSYDEITKLFGELDIEGL